MKNWFQTEDWWAVWIGLVIFGLSLLTAVGLDCLGWAASTRVWLDLGAALGPVSPAYASLPAFVSLCLTYLFLLALLCLGAWFLKLPVRAFALRFSVIFWMAIACWLMGHFAYIAATPNQRQGLGISWSMALTGEAGYILALAAGLIVSNFFPGVGTWLKEAARPEWYIKTAIVILGAALGVKAAESGESTALTQAILFRGLAACFSC